MASAKETFMKLNVHLDCRRCYTKVRELLCSIPEIKDQVYKKKENAVLIRVVCCSPEKIKDKLRRKGGKSIESIQTLHPPKPGSDAKSNPGQNQKFPNKPVIPDRAPLQPIPSPLLESISRRRPASCPDCEAGRTRGPCYNGCNYWYCYLYGCTPPPPPPPQRGGWWWYYDGCPPGGYVYRPDSWLSRCEYYFSDENPMACAIM